MAWWPKAKSYNETNNDKRNNMIKGGYKQV